MERQKRLLSRLGKTRLLCYTIRILDTPFLHRATYDADGNIVLPSEPHILPNSEAPEPVMLRAERPVAVHADAQAAAPGRIHARLARVSISTREAQQEGMQQYAVSIASARSFLTDLEEESEGIGKRLWSFLTQPVVVRSRNTHKQYGRATLFVLDILRFGGTFALIFGVLFIALNYQSFWEIGAARLRPLLAGPAVDTAQFDLTHDIVNSPAADARTPGNLLSFLPPVGPPEDRMIIPKLGLNVPLEEPSYAALLREDWSQVEKDIQSALQKGVVHYPGTARPGQAGNFFVTGHSSYYPWDAGKFKTVFARLGELEVGDEYVVYYHGDKHRYIIETKKEVKPSDISVLDQPPDRRISTLMTCTPVGTTLRRLIIVAHEVDPLTAEPMKVGERPSEQPKTPQLEALPI